MYSHEYYEQLLSVYIDSEASLDEIKIIKEHLAQCLSCQNQYKELLKLSSKLQEWPEEYLSPDLQQKIKTSLNHEGTKEAHMPIKSRWNIFATSSILVVLFTSFLLVQMFLKGNLQNRPLLAKIWQSKDFMEENKNSSKELVSHSRAAGGFQKGTYTTSSYYLSDSLEGTKQYEPYYLTSNYSGTEQYEPYVHTSYYSVSYKQPMASMILIPELTPNYNTEEYDRIYDNKFLEVTQNPLSTFSIDVDTASYSNVRRFLMDNNKLPNEDAVRIEEMINYFSYDYPQPTENDPFSVTTKTAVCPWNPQHQLALIGLQGKKLEASKIPPSNLVFLIDVSGSMLDENKLPLLKRAFQMMTNQLGSNEKVAIVAYAGAAGKVLDSTSGADKQTILNAIENLQLGGSTAGGEGIKLAYKIARENFIKDGNNRVILATDGDFNVGVSSDAEMVRLIEEERQAGVFLTVLGVGTGNYKDSKMEQLADKGNGNYYYIDNISEAKKVLVQELGSTLFAIAKDVKIQVEFNPSQVKAYRLIGYENRVMAKEDFNDDTKDAGELGAGHTVTALYEIIPADSNEKVSQVDDLAYQKSQIVPNNDLMTVKLRYKEPASDTSKLISQVVSTSDIQKEPTDDFAFAAAVAEFGMILRNSEFKAASSYDHVLKRAQSALGKDPFGHRREFLHLVWKAKSLDVRGESSGQGIQFKSLK